MRMRKKKNGQQRLENCAGFWIQNPNEYKDKWQSLFLKRAPLFIEIGCGKGGFITKLAMANPDINYIAIEFNIDVLVLATEKAKGLELNNIKFILGDAAHLCDVFEDGEVDRIYLNFSDPWHKNRHIKRRLTYKSFLDVYKKILKVGSYIYFKTDNRNLFEFSIESFSENGFSLDNITYDLHNSGYEGNVMTEYEEFFSEKGQPIYRLEALVEK